MIKKSFFLCSAVLALGLTKSLATTQPVTGLYVGGNAGFGLGKAKAHWNGKSINRNMRGLLYGAHMGLETTVWESVVPGVELYVTGSQAKAHQHNVVDAKFKRGLGWGAAVKLGAGLNQQKVMGIKVGFERLAMHNRVVTAGWKGKTNHFGVRPGIYVENHLDSMVATFEYSCGLYNKKKKTVNGTQFYVKPGTHDFMVRLSYKLSFED